MKRALIASVSALALSLAGAQAAPPRPGFFSSNNIQWDTGPIALTGVFGGAANTVFPTTTGGIGSLGTRTGGSGYTSGTAVLSLGTITGGSGCAAGSFSVALTDATTPAATGAVATVNTYGGAVISVTITSHGANNAGYLVNDALTGSVSGCSGWSVAVAATGAFYDNVAFTGGSGSGAKGQFQIASGGTAISSVALEARGTGYKTTDTLGVAAASVGGTGSGFSIPVAVVGAPTSASTDPTNFTSVASGVSADPVETIYNNFTYTADTVQDTSSPNGVVAFNWNLNTGGGQGSRLTGQFVLNLNVAPIDTTWRDYTSLSPVTQISVPGPTGTAGAGNGRGDAFSLNPICRLLAGALYWHQCIGQENDLDIRPGATVDVVIGEQIVQSPGYENASLINTLGYSINKSLAANPGFDMGFADGSYDGFPSIKTTGELVGCWVHASLTNTNGHAAAGNCGSIYAGVDLYNYSAVSGFTLRGPQGNGYIDGSFNFVGGTITISGTATTQNGMHVSGAGNTTIDSGNSPVAQFASTNSGFEGIDINAPINSTDQFATFNNTNGVSSATLRNSSTGTAAKETLYFGNSNAINQAGVALNGGAFSGGQGANALQLFNTANAPIVFGTGSEVLKVGTTGGWTANGSTTACVGTLGPSGIHSTVQEWLTFTDASGTVRYIPAC